MQLLLIIFCLGIFLIPKDNFYAQASQENCCKTEKTNSCCDNHDNHSQKDGKSCNDDCCSVCLVCTNLVEINYFKDSWVQFPAFENIAKIRFQYSDPYISNSLEEIWQPPKLG